LKVLVVHSGNKRELSPYIKEQVDSLIQEGVNIEYFTITSKGIFGYLKCLPKYFKKVRSFNPDIIHAHSGLSGLFANFIRRKKVITTFHGSDVYLKRNRILSRITYFLSAENIFVSTTLKNKLNVHKALVITCGVDTDFFYPTNKVRNANEILFSGSFDDPAKNFQLAEKAVEIYNIETSSNLKLIELKNKSRKEVAELMNNVLFLLITSHYEGSSQVLKEAMACNCPVIGVRVGSLPELLKDGKGGVLFNGVQNEFIEAVELIVSNDYSNGRPHIIENGLSLKDTALKIKSVYQKYI
jgi:glycosyltransferase involved in cell wall biosynthesis